MNQEEIQFQVINWDNSPKTEHKGTKGLAFWQTQQFPGVRIRIVEYSAGYLADHWCTKGHIVHCLKGDFRTELQDGRTFHLQKGMTYVVSDDLSSHRSTTDHGVTLLIIDGEFLNRHSSDKKSDDAVHR
jgi:hypothetical protein